ncbi:hypothetical protein LguiA_000696 [Lonicera macranthoides]
MTYAGIEAEELVHKYYHRETYLKWYENFIQPLNGPQLWPKSDMPHVLPLTYGTQLGQKKKKIRLEPDELKKKIQMEQKVKKHSHISWGRSTRFLLNVATVKRKIAAYMGNTGSMETIRVVMQTHGTQQSYINNSKVQGGCAASSGSQSIN